MKDLAFRFLSGNGRIKKASSRRSPSKKVSGVAVAWMSFWIGGSQSNGAPCISQSQIESSQGPCSSSARFTVFEALPYRKQ